jgi:hypothetical protein
MSLSRARLKALDAALATLTPQSVSLVPRPVEGPPAPEEPMVAVPLRIALEAQAALYQRAAELRTAARATHGPTSDDVAGAWTRASNATLALEALTPLVEAARQENRRRWAEHKAEWDGLRREANAPGEAA